MTKIGKGLKGLMLGILFISVASAAADDIRVQATTDHDIIDLGDTVTITVAVQSGQAVEANEPRVPNLDGWHLMNSWSSASTSSKLMQGPNGMQFQTLRRHEYNFTFSPNKRGSLQIGSFEVVVDGKAYHTKPMVIKVEAGTTVAKNKRSRPNTNDDDISSNLTDEEAMFQQLLRRRGEPKTPPANKLNDHNTNEAFFVQVELDKTNVFEGEQVTANWYIYTRGNILALDRVKFPDLKGFWKEIIEEVPALNFQSEIVNGVPFRKALLASHALFPIKAGTAVVDEYKIKATVQTASGPFGFGPPYSYTRSSERVPITVKALPTEGRPSDFTGAVGSFEVRASVDGPSFPANQPFSLKVRFDGAGNAKTIELPNLGLPPGLEVYDTKNESKFFKNGRSYKEFEVLIVPRQEGDISIPALKASMFDPAGQKYYTKTTEPIHLKITPSVNGTPSNLSKTTSPNPAVASAPPARHIPDLVVAWNSTWNPNSPVGTAASVALWILILAALFWKWRLERGDQGPGVDLHRQFEKRCEKINKLLEAQDWRGVGTEVSNLIYFVLGEIAGEKGGSQELQKLLDLAPPSVRRELGKDLQKEIETFQTIGFAPESMLGQWKESAKLKSEFQSVTKTLKKAMKLARVGD